MKNNSAFVFNANECALLHKTCNTSFFLNAHGEVKSSVGEANEVFSSLLSTRKCLVESGMEIEEIGFSSRCQKSCFAPEAPIMLVLVSVSPINLLAEERQDTFLLRKEHTCVNNEQEIARVKKSHPQKC